MWTHPVDIACLASLGESDTNVPAHDAVPE